MYTSKPAYYEPRYPEISYAPRYTRGTLAVSEEYGKVNVEATVGKLIEGEKITMLKPLLDDEKRCQSKISAFGEFKQAIEEFQKDLTKIGPTTFSARKADTTNNGFINDTLSETKPFTADLSSEAAISPNAQIIQSAGIQDVHEVLCHEGDAIMIKVGSNAWTRLTFSGDQNLEGLVDGINNAHADVEASIMTDALGSHLVLEANRPGTANTIRVVTTTKSLRQFEFNTASDLKTAMTQTQAPQDAVTAALSSYDIEVTEMAKTDKLKSTSYRNDKTFKKGVLSIKVGDHSRAIIRPTVKTLAGVRDAINASPNAGVNANIINDGTRSYLVLTAKNSGDANKITVTGTLDFELLNNAAMEIMCKAANATVKVDGVDIESPSNKVTNAIPGVTLNLNRTTTDKEKISMSISNDSSGLENAVESFLTSYNNLAGKLKTLTCYNADAKTPSRLQSDSSVNYIQSSILNILLPPIGGSTLYDIGVNFEKDGTLKLDNSKLKKVMDSNFNAVEPLFNGRTGVATKLKALCTDILSKTGSVSTHLTDLKTRLERDHISQDTVNERILADQARFMKQFQALDATLSKTASLSKYLDDMFNRKSPL